MSYLGADEHRFTRTDEAPAIVPVPRGNVPADGIRLAVVPPGGEPEVSARPVAGPRDGSVAELSLADDAVTSRALAEADGGASGQDTATGSGVKSGPPPGRRGDRGQARGRRGLACSSASPRG